MLRCWQKVWKLLFRQARTHGRWLDLCCAIWRRELRQGLNTNEICITKPLVDHGKVQRALPIGLGISLLLE